MASCAPTRGGRALASLVVRVPTGETHVRRPTTVLVALALAIGLAGQAVPVRAAGPSARVAIIVGPVGAELTPAFIGLAEAAARAAEAHGATVARAYSPDATPDNVLAAVAGANIVIYLGHGVGSPNPYSPHPNPATTNGWGLNGPSRRGDHSDSWRDGTLAYYGEAWITTHARPAPGWVMIYSNACYAAGASEDWVGPATAEEAAARVAAYSRAPLAELGASAYFATDFYEGAAHLVDRLLGTPTATYGDIFAGVPNFEAAALSRLTDAAAPSEVWLHRSSYFDGKLDYWYAFAGDPGASPATTMLAGVAGVAGAPGAARPAAAVTPTTSAIPGVVTGLASSYGFSRGWEGRATVALPLALGGRSPGSPVTTAVVCADRCAELPVVDSCPCYFGTADQRIANLSHAAWSLISDAPLAEGLVQVTVHLGGEVYDPPPIGPPANAATPF